MTAVTFFRIAVFALEVLACIAGFATSRDVKNSFWKWLPIYLLVIVLGELAGFYLAYVPELNVYNPKLFNCVLCPLQIIFFTWLLYKNLAGYNRHKAKWILCCMMVYIACFAADLYFMPKDNFWVCTFSFSVGMLLLLLSILLFFYEYIKSNAVIDFKTDRIFWICLGLFFYYVVALPFEGLRNTLLKQPGLFMAWWYLDMSLACLMYLSFTISFVWAKPR